MKNAVYLVDAYAHIYRGYYAISYMKATEAGPSNAIFAMTKFMLTLESEFKPNYGAFIFDKGKPKNRIEILPEYKATRPPMPEDLRMQTETIKQVISAFGWKIIEIEGIEADDLLASIAIKFKKDEAFIVSNDKDLSQVVGDGIKMLVTTPGVKGFLERSRKEVVAKFGVPPELIVDYLALIGDAADNIKGIDGVGPKTAAKLLAEGHCLEKLLAESHLIKNDSLRQKIIDGQEIILRNKKLIELEKFLDIKGISEKNDISIASPKKNVLMEIARKYELKSLFADIEKLEDKEELEQGELCFN